MPLTQSLGALDYEGDPMNVLQEVFEEVLQSELSPEVVGALFIRQKLEEKGVSLTEDQFLDIQQKLRRYQGEPFTVDLGGSAEGEEEIVVDLEEGESIEEFVNGLIFKAVPEIVKATAGEILRILKQNLGQLLKERAEERESFEKRLHEVWGEAFNLLEMLVHLSLEAGDDFNREFRDEMASEENFVFEALTRLHARACQVASEVLTLLKSGYADGAHARWRSLHEIAVVSLFIDKYGNEVAERYLLHDSVESYKAARLYQKYHERLGVEPLSTREMEELESVYNALIERFGSDYKNQYGWASTALGKAKPTFRDIEEDVSLDHLHPYYKLASHNVHANPKGVFFRLGLYPESTDILLAGPSNTGFADPAHGTALSLSQATITLLMMRPNIDRLVFSEVLLMLTDEIGEAFLSIQKSLENQSRPTPRAADAATPRANVGGNSA